VDDRRLDRELEQLHHDAVRHRSTIRTAWHAPPPQPGIPAHPLDTDRTHTSDIPDPVAAMTHTTWHTRTDVVRHIAQLVTDLAHTLEQVGQPMPDTARHATVLADTPLDRLRLPDNRTADVLLQLHAGLYRTLLDLVAAWTRTGHTDDGKIMLVHARRCGSDLRRAAGRAHANLTLPDHPDATRQRTCDDRHGYGCTRTLPSDTDTSRCRSCENRAYRDRRQHVEHLDPVTPHR